MGKALTKTFEDYPKWLFECSCTSEPSTVMADLIVPVFRIKATLAKGGGKGKVLVSHAEDLQEAWEQMVLLLDGENP